MDIRKADSKGRLSVGEDGVIYSVAKDLETGVITLNPVNIPEPPDFERQGMRAIYVKPGLYGAQPTVTTIVSVMGSTKHYAEWVAELANREFLPVVIKEGGVGGVLTDMLTELVDRDVVTVR